MKDFGASHLSQQNNDHRGKTTPVIGGDGHELTCGRKYWFSCALAWLAVWKCFTIFGADTLDYNSGGVRARPITPRPFAHLFIGFTIGYSGI
jgi:hypothetical protein